jgi:hypothetical protein
MARFPWLTLRKKTDPELPIEPPIWLGNHSNGEYFHEQTSRERKLRELILQKADDNARRLGLERREFLTSAMGMATSLWVINGCASDDDPAGAGGTGGGFCVPEQAQFDESLACEALGGNEFIFDIQTHHFDPDAEWVERNPAYLAIIGGNCGIEPKQECVSMERYLELMFFESQTTMAALSTWPAALCTETRTTNCGLPLPNTSVAESRNIINMAARSQRIVNHCQVMPNDDLARQLAIMEEIACSVGVAAWKCYPAWGPTLNMGFFLDDPAVGIPFIEKGRELGVKVFCVHKGLPIPGFDLEHNKPTEMGRVAKLYPDCHFIIYHSAICASLEGFGSCNPSTEPGGDGAPYDPNNAGIGCNMLIKALQEQGLARYDENDQPTNVVPNVYGELGSAFSQVRDRPIAAQHFIGKLLKYLGEDNVMWGTDAILFGSPQVLIEPFRALEISPELQQQYGYPALTAEVKAKIFGRNAARIYGVDPEAMRCQIDRSRITAAAHELDGEIGGRRFALRPPLGPRTRREFLQLARRNRALGVPG